MSLSHWARLLVWLAVETTALAAGAAILHLMLSSPRAGRTIWRAALISVALVWMVELSGLREKMPGSDSKQSRFVPGSMLLPPSMPQFPADDRRVESAVMTAPAPGLSAAKWPAWIWLGGSMFFLARFCLARVWLAARRRAAAPADQDSLGLIARWQTSFGLRRVASQVWRCLRAPVAFGIFRPTVALPPDFAVRFSFAEREAMLAHEMAHLAAHDPFWWMASDAVIALAWWHPLVWWARRRLQSASEAAADEASALIPGGARALAECLVRLGRELASSGPARALGVGGAGLRSQLAARIELLLQGPRVWRPSSVWARWTPHVSAIFVAVASILFPIQTGLSGSIFTVLAAATPVREAAANPPSKVSLLVQSVFITESDSDDIGLDWVFGLAPANNPALETSHDWKALRKLPPGHGNRLVIDRLKTEGQSAVLKPEQFTALRDRIVRHGDILTSPACVTSSGLQAHMAVQDLRTIVTDVDAKAGSQTRSASIGYLTDDVALGFAVDVIPTVEYNGKWRLCVLASFTSFVGYDKAANEMDLKVSAPNGGTITYVNPQPHFRVAEAVTQDSVLLGQTLVLRGPLWAETTKTKTVCQRLYVFVTPTRPPPSDSEK